MLKNYGISSILWVQYVQEQSRPNSRQMVHNSYIFININFWHTAYTIALKMDTYFGKKRDLLQRSIVMSTHLRGPTSMLASWNYISFFTFVPVFNFLAVP